MSKTALGTYGLARRAGRQSERTESKDPYAVIEYGAVVRLDVAFPLYDPEHPMRGDVKTKQPAGSQGTVADSHVLKGGYGYSVDFGREDGYQALVRADYLTVVPPQSRKVGG